VKASTVDKANSGSGTKVESLMCHLEFSQQTKLLQDPHVWSVDKGTTVKSSPHENGMENTNKV